MACVVDRSLKGCMGGRVMLGSSPWEMLSFSPTNLDKQKAADNLATIIHGKWNYYVGKLGNPKTESDLAKIRGSIAADLIREKVPFTNTELNAATGSFITGGLSPGVMIKNAAVAIENAIPWYLHPKNILLLGGGAVVLYFTWPMVLKMGFGTVKRGVRAFSKGGGK